jgi:TolA-binding protein
MKVSSVLLCIIVILSNFLLAQDMDVLQGIQRTDTSGTLTPLELDEIPDSIKREGGNDTSSQIISQSRQELIDSLEYRFNLEKERLEANFKTSYEYRLSRAVDSIRLSIADQINVLEDEINRLRRSQRSDSTVHIPSTFKKERDSLFTELQTLKREVRPADPVSASVYSTEDLKREQALYQYLLELVEQKSESRFFWKNRELAELKKAELSLYLEKYLPDLNSGEVLIRLARVYQDEKEGDAAKLTYLKYLFYFPESSNLSYISEQVHKLAEKYPNPRDSILYDYLSDEYRNTLQGCTRFKVIRAMADLGYADGEPLFDREMHRYQVESPDDENIDRTLFWYAEMLHERKMFRSAIWQLEKIIKVYPGSSYIPRAIYYAAEIIRKDLKESRTALEKLKTLAEKYPEDKLAPKALLMRGDIYEKDMKDPVAALTEYESVQSQYAGKREAIEALNNMGRIYQTLSKSPELALKQYGKIKKEYAFYPVDAAKAMIVIAGLYEKQGNYSEAVQEIEELYKRYPEYTKVADQLLKAAGFLEKQLSNPDKAITLYEILVSEYPETPASAKAAKALNKLQKD